MIVNPLCLLYFCIFLFFSLDLHRIQSKHHVEKLQEQAQLRLLDSILAHGPRARFGQILLKLSLLSEVSPSFIEKSFFKGGLENISDDFSSSSPEYRSDETHISDKNIDGPEHPRTPTTSDDDPTVEVLPLIKVEIEED